MNPLEPFLQRVARVAMRAGIGPNAITTTGLGISLGAAIAFAGGAVRWGGALVLAGALFDLLDGRVARLGTRGTTFGALYDSVSDRLGEAAVCAGIAWFLLRGGASPGRAAVAVMIVVAALSATLIASYVRARAEGLGVEARGGVPAGAARAGLLGLPPLVAGPGRGASLLFWMMVLFALVSAATAVQRMVAVARSNRGVDPLSRQRVTLPGRAAHNRHMPRGEAPR
jgi:CDP-diacylglycerol--glycerol-3-phosphate 3-phosphatidyltransferase